MNKKKATKKKKRSRKRKRKTGRRSAFPRSYESLPVGLYALPEEADDRAKRNKLASNLSPATQNDTRGNLAQTRAAGWSNHVIAGLRHLTYNVPRATPKTLPSNYTFPNACINRENSRIMFAERACWLFSGNANPSFRWQTSARLKSY